MLFDPRDATADLQIFKSLISLIFFFFGSIQDTDQYIQGGLFAQFEHLRC